MADVTQLPTAAPSSEGGDVSPIAKRIKRELLLKKAAKDARKHNTDGDMNAQHQRFSFEQELQSKVMAKRLKLRSIHRRFKSSSEAMMCRLYKDLNDFPDFPNVSVKLIFANGNQHTFQRIGVDQREALEHTQQALDHELQQHTNHHHQPQPQQSPVSSLEEDSDASIVDEDGDVVALKVVITPMRGPWKHVAVPFRLDLPKTYPHEPPKITCIKRIYHPSVDQRGYVCLGLINEWESFLNLEAVVIELENLLVDPSPRRPLVKDVGNELFENPELFEENVKISMRGGVVRGVYYDRLAGVPPVDIGHDTLRNICFNKIFEYLKADKRAELKLKMQSRATLSPRAAYEVELLNEKGKEILKADDQVVSAVPVTNDNNNFDKEGIKHLPIELREIVEDYMSIIDTNERHRRARKIIKAQQANAVIGGKLFVKNLAGNMIQLDGVRPDMTIWQVKELLDTKTGMVPHTIQLFWHQVLDDKKTVADYGMRQGSVLYIVLSWGGG